MSEATAHPTKTAAPTGPTDPASVHGRFLPGAHLGERYRIVGLLGRGGMGEVYRADDLELGQSVALKFLPEKLAAEPAALSRLRSEVRTARRIALKPDDGEQEIRHGIHVVENWFSEHQR